MKKTSAPVSFVRFRRPINSKLCGPFEMVDIIYQSGKLVSLGIYEIPKTIQRFIQTANHITNQTDSLWGRETIYENV